MQTLPSTAPTGANTTRTSEPQGSGVETPAFESTSHPAFAYNASLHSIDTAPLQAHPAMTQTPTRASPLSAELRVQTDLKGPDLHQAINPKMSYPSTELPFEMRQRSSSNLPVRTSSQRSTLSAYNAGTFSPASAISSTVSSPGVGPLMDITPLPSPLVFEGSPGPWRRAPSLSQLSPPTSNYEPSPTSPEELPPSALGLGIRSSPKKQRKTYQGLISAATLKSSTEAHTSIANESSHARNRSLSEYVPVGITAHRPRNIAVSSAQAPTENDSLLSPMHREEHLAIKRGLSPLPAAIRPPTPPRSNNGLTDSSDIESPPSSPQSRRLLGERFEAEGIKDGKTRHWTAIRQLGKGAFSTVMLATSDPIGPMTSEGSDGSEAATRSLESSLNPKHLVAVKVCQHGPAGGADEQRVGTSLTRELEILEIIRHPSLVHLRAVSVTEKQANLVLNYAPGGDLFELANSNAELLVPSLIRRIFAELVDAVTYLHENLIVHRDIKLENVLVNLPSPLIPAITDWQTYPHPIITLTDLGLGRNIPPPPASPLLNTRCGSEDYAAPEVLMGQEYDGRAADAWALGVLLYALIEGQLPFEPTPGARRQSPKKHRIARCEWQWVKFADADGDWIPGRGTELEGGRDCVEGLVRRAKKRWDLAVLKERDWVSGGVDVEGGLKVEGEEEEEEKNEE